MDIASVFEWFAQESKSIAEQAAEPEQREKFAELALLWASAAQQCSGGAPAIGHDLVSKKHDGCRQDDSYR